MFLFPNATDFSSLFRLAAKTDDCVCYEVACNEGTFNIWIDDVMHLIMEALFLGHLFKGSVYLRVLSIPAKVNPGLLWCSYGQAGAYVVVMVHAHSIGSGGKRAKEDSLSPG